MNYFIVSFKVTIDGKEMTHDNQAETTTAQEDYDPDNAIRATEEWYKKKFPAAKKILVVIVNNKSVSRKKYLRYTFDAFGQWGMN